MNCSKLFFVVLLLVTIGTRSFAQSGIARDTTHWRDEDIYTDDDSRSSVPSYNWLGGGFVAGAFIADVSSLNTNIAMPFIKQNLSGTVPMFGGRGFIPFPWVKNLVIGGVGFGGMSQVCCVPDTTGSGQPVMRTLRYSVGYGGISLDYAIPIRWSRVHILAGIELGLGSVNIWAKQAAARTSFDISSEFDQPSTNITHTYSASMFVYKPQVSFEWAPWNFLMLRVSAAYQGSSVSTWKADEDVGLGNTDQLAKINGSGFVANAGIYLGIFQ
ncbi:MAG TPA: hypothetical protein VEW28_08275 [Candidatus Kapabacteria bacterium]|nr:hypothetical protein [Candidatus Kapabacteria bacterium]